MRVEICNTCRGEGVVRKESKDDTCCYISYVKCKDCNGLGVILKTMSRGDEIRTKSNRELAEWIVAILSGVADLPEEKTIPELEKWVSEIR